MDLDWIKDLRSNKEERVVVNGSAAQWCHVTSDFPKGLSFLSSI